MAEVEIIENNVNEVRNALRIAKIRALTIIGIKAEGYAKYLCPVGTPESTGVKGYRGGTLRNSITNVVQEDTVIIGTNVEYGPYVELGTGPYFTPPPEWEQFIVPPSQGIGKAYVHARPYLRPAVEDHLNEYRNIIESECQDAMR